jgi:hypothetical protein
VNLDAYSAIVQQFQFGDRAVVHAPADSQQPGETRVGVVPHTGFEPVISALRGRCPRPLDECGEEWGA